MGTLICNHCHTEFEPGEQETAGIFKCPHCNGTVLPSETEEELPSGFMLGGFEIVKLLGRGGMGNVYLATQLSMQRHVALKVLPKVLTRDGGSVRKFLNEVKNSGRLQHAHIVTAIDAGEDNGIYFLAMQYVAGETLEAKIDRDKRISEADALDYALMIAEGLKYAWDRQNIFHKDIKPGNIIIEDATGEAFLLDMGISQKIGETAHQDDSIEGSPFYMSPEQSRGEKLDWSTDLYSLGATLYNAVTGVPPYDDKDVMRIVEMHSTAPFPEPARRAPESKVSLPVVKLLKKMLGKKPADRHKSWAEFIKECTKIHKELGSKSRRTKILKTHSAGTVHIEKKKSHPALVLTSVALFLAVLGIGGFLGYKEINKAGAKKALEKAEDYITRPGYELQNAIELFSVAKDFAGKPGVTEDVSRRAVNGYAAIRSAAERRASEQEAFESAMKAATVRFSKAKELHIQGKEAIRLNQADDSSLAKSMAEAKATLKMTSAINTEDTKESQRLAQFKDAVGALIKMLEDDMGRKSRMEADVEAKSKAKAEGESKAKTQAESYKQGLAKKQEELRMAFVIGGKRREFDAVRERFAIPKETAPQNDAQCRREALVFNLWVASTTEKLNRAAKVWAAISDSGTRLAGKVITVNNKSCAINSIDKGEMRHSNGTTSLSDLSPSDMLLLLKKALPEEEEDSTADLIAFLIASGDFEEAASCAGDEETRKEISAFAKAYIKARMQKAIKDNAAGKPGAMERLKQDYGSMREYSEVAKLLGLAAAPSAPAQN